MANKFKELQEEKEACQTPKAQVPPPPSPKKKKSRLIQSLNTLFSGTFLEHKKALNHIPFLLFLSFLAILYIATGYWAEDKIRQVNKLSSVMKELRSEFISTKSDLMFISRQSEVAKSALQLGLFEPIHPPLKITVDSTSFASPDKHTIK